MSPTDRVISEGREYLKRLADVPDLRASVSEYCVIHPVKICPCCRGKGVITTRLKQDFMCEECRGFRKVRLTKKEIRQRYRIIRTYACTKFVLLPKQFDILVKRRLRRTGVENPTPGHFLSAASYLASPPTSDVERYMAKFSTNVRSLIHG